MVQRLRERFHTLTLFQGKGLIAALKIACVIPHKRLDNQVVMNLTSRKGPGLDPPLKMNPVKTLTEVTTYIFHRLIDISHF
ncbi:hypothetical protein EB241_11365 [Erwinia psidii]|uniref:Uncharacterized protein n=1 Tax=Erwinia psidii TaxID=69224 RepID=A0A3N6RYU1_9GAMM|nr:hypothetical protein EB241_11365 [Erwinia psidii]